MDEIKGINHIGIRISNLSEARTFYEQFGFVFIAGPMGPEPIAIMEHPSGINLNLIINADSNLQENILMDITERHPGYTHIALDVSDIKIIEKRVNELGIEITEGPVTLPDGAEMFFIRDQDSNVIEFHKKAE